jgi:hypothetical protein
MMSNHFTCHWDESGSDPGTETRSKSDLPILVVSGYLAHVKDWNLFESDWSPIMEEHELVNGFHMTTFANNKRPYCDWDEDKRDALIDRLLNIIAERPHVFVSFGIRTDDYFEVVKARNLLETDIVRAYHICARRCMEIVSDLALLGAHRHKILHIFHHGNAAWPSFAETFTQPMLDRLNILLPISQSAVDVVPLQAADILAHQIARDTLVSMGHRNIPKKLYMKRLAGKSGFRHIISINELKELYREELMLEDHRSRNTYPTRAIRPDAQSGEMRFLASHLFTEPEHYDLNIRTKEIQ